jgi:NADH-quinone oxidoreductase subunit H
MVLSVLGVVIQAGTLDMNKIVWAQNHDSIFGFSWIGNPYVLTQGVGFLIFMISVQAELTQTPFDMPVAESELVAGYMTEYSGFRFLTFFIAEFATAGAFAAIASTLFLGGWGMPAKWFGWTSLQDVGQWMNFAGPLILFSKIMLLGFVIFWVRFTYPRFREDQLQKFAWKVLIPLSLLNIAVTAVLKVMF